VLAEALLTAIHHLRDLSQILLHVRVRQVGDALGPRYLRLGQQRVDALSDPGVDHRGDVACPGQVPRLNRSASDLGWVKPGQFG